MPAMFFKAVKQTKGTVVFEQCNEDGSEHFAPSIRTLYLAKHDPLARQTRLVMELKPQE